MHQPGDVEAAVRSVLAGDREAFRVIIDACEAKVRTVLGAIVQDRDSVDDLAQEVFVTAYAKLAEYRAGTDLAAWVRAIARHLALNERKRWIRNRSFRRGYRAKIEERISEDVQRAAQPIDGEPIRALRECVETLAERARGLVRQFYFEGKSSAEIADAHDKTTGWARIVLHRARLSIGECLRRKGILSGG